MGRPKIEITNERKEELRIKANKASAKWRRNNRKYHAEYYAINADKLKKNRVNKKSAI